MSTRIYVENLPATTSSADLTKLFSAYGSVMDVNLATDRNPPQSPGFGFVTMVTSEGARAAIQGLHGRQMASQTLIFTEARPPGRGTAGTQPPPQPARPYHPLLPNLKKNGIIPLAPGPDDTKRPAREF